MGKIKFVKVTDGVYYLKTPLGNQWNGIALIKGKTPESTVLIDTGANDNAVFKYLLPALRNIRTSPRHIGTVLFTHFHPGNIGGISALRKENPAIKVIVPRGYRDMILNPMVSIMAERERFPEYNSHYYEVRGVYPDREMTEAEQNGEEKIVGLTAVRVSGHSDGFCWFHGDSHTLICGDLLQGNGNKELCRPYYTDLNGYKNSIEKLRSLTEVEHMISGCELDGLDDLINGQEAYQKALNRCEDCVFEMEKVIRHHLRQGTVDIAEIAKKIVLEYSDSVPEGLSCVMQSISAHLDAINKAEHKKGEEKKNL